MITRPHRRRNGRARLALTAALLTASSALAGNLTWDSSGANPPAPTDGPGSWDTSAANWSNGTSDVVWDNASTAVFGRGNGAAGVVTIDDALGSVTATGLIFNAPGSGSYTIAANPGDVLNLSGSNPVISIATGVSATISAPITGSFGTGNIATGAGLIINGGGNLILAGTYSYSGATSITGPAGTTVGTNVTLANGGSIGTSGGDFYVGVIGTGQTTDTSTFTFAGSGTLTAGTLFIEFNKVHSTASTTVGSTLQVNGNDTINADNIRITAGESNGSTKGGDGALKLGAGAVLTLNGAAGPGNNVGLFDIANYSFESGGGTTSSIFGTADFSLGTVNGHINVMNVGTAKAGSGGSAGLATGGFSFFNGNLTIDTINIARRAGSSQGAVGNFTLVAGGTGVINSNSLTFGAVASGAGAGSSNGTVTISGGNLVMSGDITSALTNAANAVMNLSGGLLDMGNHNIGSSTNPITVNATAGTLKNVQSINSTGGLTMTGTGVFVLDGTNSFTGNLAVNNGTVRLNTDMAAQMAVLAPAGSGAIAFAPGYSTYTVGGLSGAGNISLSDTNGSPVTLQAGNNNGTQTYSGVLSGGGAFTKIGTGKITLTANHTYSGATTINGGTLAVSGSTASANTTVNNGGALVVTGGLNASGNLAVNSGGLLAGNMPSGKSLGHVTLSGGTIIAGQDTTAGLLHSAALDLNGGTLQFNLGATTTSSVIDSTSVNVNNSLSINVPIGAASPGVYTLVQSASPITYAGGAALTLFGPGGAFAYSLDTTSNNKFIFLDVVGAVTHLVWTGAADNTTWDTAAANWTNTDTNAPNQAYADPANVTFNDTAPGSATAINLTTTVAPASVTVGGISNNYTIQGGGSIGGLLTTLTKNGTTTLALLTNNNFGGGATLNGGTTQINSATSLGTLSGTATINAATLEVLGGNNITSTRNINLGSASSAITVDGGATYVNSGVLADGAASGRLNAFGSGTLVLQGTNTYTGGTSIGGNGTVQINSNNSLGTGSVIIGNGTLDATATSTATRIHQLTDPGSTIGAETGVTYTINGVVADGATTGTLNKIGAGTLALGATNTYSGGTKVLAGAVSITSDGNLGNSPAAPTPANVALGSGATNGILAVGSTMTLNPNRGIGINGTGTISVAASQTFTYGGVIADNGGSGSLGVGGGGTFSVTGSSTYTGVTTVNGATLQLAAGTNHLPTGNTWNTTTTGVIVLGDANGPASQTVATFSSGGASPTPSVLGGNAGLSTLTIVYNGAAANYSRGIGGPGPNQNNVAIVFSGTGALRLNAAGGANADNTYTGGTTINSGTLVAAQTHGFGAVSGLVTINGGTMGLEAGTTPATGIAAYNVAIPDAANSAISVGRNTNGAGFQQTLGSLTIGAATANIAAGATVTSGTASLAFSGATVLSSTAGGTVNFTTNNVDVTFGSVTGSALTGNTTILQLDGNSTSTSGNVITGTLSPGPNGGNLAVVKSNSSQWTLAGNSTYAGGTTIQSGTLITNTNFSNGTLNLQGGTARVAQRPNNNESDHVTLVPAVQFNGGAIDLTNNAMIIDYGPLDTSPLDSVRQAVANGYAGGAWNGNGVNSSTAAASTSPKTAIGYAEASTLGITNFHGYIVDGSAVLLAYTVNGDANLDGKVNALDFNALATNFGAGSNLWTKGDFNFDGNVDSLDFNALAVNFNQSTAAPALGTLVPEPVMVPMIGLLALLHRRARKAR